MHETPSPPLPPPPPPDSTARVYTHDDELCIELPPTGDAIHARQLSKLAAYLLAAAGISLVVGVVVVEQILLVGGGFAMLAVGLTLFTVAWVGRRTTVTLRLSDTRLRAEQKTPLGTSGREWQLQHLDDITVRGSLHHGSKPSYALCVIDVGKSRTSVVDHRRQDEMAWVRDVLLSALGRETKHGVSKVW